MRKVLVTIRRPNGEMETKDIADKFSNMNDALFANLQKQFKVNGCGELLSYTVDHGSYDDLSDETKEEDRKAAFFRRHSCAAK